jgi:hypothetical protein
MLSQRPAKLALLGGLVDPGRAAAAAHEQAEATVLEFERELVFLDGATRGSEGVTLQLETASAAWRQMRGAVAQAGSAQGRVELAAISEAVLESFEELTDQLERSVHVLLGASGGRAARPANAT